MIFNVGWNFIVLAGIIIILALKIWLRTDYKNILLNIYNNNTTTVVYKINNIEIFRE